MPDGFKPIIFYALATSDAARTIAERCNELAAEGHILLPVHISQKSNGLSFLLLYGTEATIDELGWWLR
jgi:hypothetical protein